MNRQKFMKIVAGSMFATVTIPSVVSADQEKHQLVLRLRKDYSRVCGKAARLRGEVIDLRFRISENATVEEIKGFERGYVSCLDEIRRQTKFSPKKCLEYDGVMYIAGIRGCVL